MIGNKTLKKFGFNNIEDYFLYIIESEINGNYKQMKELFNRLSNEQKKSFLNYLDENKINNISLSDLI